MSSEYTLRIGYEVTESPVGIIRFQISPTGYISLDDIFPQRVALNKSSGRSIQGFSFECTLGICADYLVKGSIKAVNGDPTLYLEIRKR